MGLPEDDVEELEPEAALARILDHEHDAIVVGPGLRPGLATPSSSRMLLAAGRRRPGRRSCSTPRRCARSPRRTTGGRACAGRRCSRRTSASSAGSARGSGHDRMRTATSSTTMRPGAAARDAAAVWGHVVVLKGARTVIASPDGESSVAPFENPALATGGTGDVLAGTIGSLLAQGLRRSRPRASASTSTGSPARGPRAARRRRPARLRPARRDRPRPAAPGDDGRAAPADKRLGFRVRGAGPGGDGTAIGRRRRARVRSGEAADRGATRRGRAAAAPADRPGSSWTSGRSPATSAAIRAAAGRCARRAGRQGATHTATARDGRAALLDAAGAEGSASRRWTRRSSCAPRARRCRSACCTRSQRRSSTMRCARGFSVAGRRRRHPSKRCWPPPRRATGVTVAARASRSRSRPGSAGAGHCRADVGGDRRTRGGRAARPSSSACGPTPASEDARHHRRPVAAGSTGIAASSRQPGRRARRAMSRRAAACWPGVGRVRRGPARALDLRDRPGRARRGPRRHAPRRCGPVMSLHARAGPGRRPPGRLRHQLRPDVHGRSARAGSRPSRSATATGWPRSREPGGGARSRAARPARRQRDDGRGHGRRHGRPGPAGRRRGRVRADRRAGRRTRSPSRTWRGSAPRTPGRS